MRVLKASARSPSRPEKPCFLQTERQTQPLQTGLGSSVSVIPMGSALWRNVQKPVLSSCSSSASPGVACDCGNNFVDVISKLLIGELIAGIWRTHFRSTLSSKRIGGSWQGHCQVGEFGEVWSICCITCIGYLCDDTSGCSRSTVGAVLRLDFERTDASAQFSWGMSCSQQRSRGIVFLKYLVLG